MLVYLMDWIHYWTSRTLDLFVPDIEHQIRKESYIVANYLIKYLLRATDRDYLDQETRLVYRDIQNLLEDSSITTALLKEWLYVQPKLQIMFQVRATVEHYPKSKRKLSLQAYEELEPLYTIFIESAMTGRPWSHVEQLLWRDTDAL